MHVLLPNCDDDVISHISLSTHIQLFYDSIESYACSLSSLSQPHETYRLLLVPFMLNKFPPEVRTNLARQHGSDDWTIDELQGALLTAIRILDFLEMGSHHPFKNQSNAQIAAS